MATLATVAAVGVAVAGVAKGMSGLWSLYQAVKPNKQIKDDHKIAKYAGKFATFDENIIFKQCEGCDPTKWHKYIHKLCKRHKIPNDYATDFLDDIDIAEKASTKRNQFEFKEGTGVFIIGGFAAKKRFDDKIDFVMWYFSCTYSTKTKIVTTKEKKALNKYFHHRASILFEQKMPIPNDASEPKKLKKSKKRKSYKHQNDVSSKRMVKYIHVDAQFDAALYLHKAETSAWSKLGDVITVQIGPVTNSIRLKTLDLKSGKSWHVCLTNTWLKRIDDEQVVQIHGIRVKNKKIASFAASFRQKIFSNHASEFMSIIVSITQNVCNDFFCKSQKNSKTYCNSCRSSRGSRKIKNKY